MHQSTHEVLAGLGLEEKEAATYLALLELGEATILKISRRSGVKRPTTYLILGELEKKGFVSRVVRYKKTFYVPQHPQKLVAEAEIRLKELQSVMPQFEALFHKAEQKPCVVMFEGKERLDMAYDELFVVKGEVLFISSLELSQEAFPRSYRKLDYSLFSPKFRTREIISDSAEGRAYATRVHGPYREVRFIPKELLPFEMDIGIFGNRTLITSVKKEFFTISIESDEMAQAFRTMFHVMWNVANA